MLNAPPTHPCLPQQAGIKKGPQSAVLDQWIARQEAAAGGKANASTQRLSFEQFVQTYTQLFPHAASGGGNDQGGGGAPPLLVTSSAALTTGLGGASAHVVDQKGHVGLRRRSQGEFGGVKQYMSASSRFEQAADAFGSTQGGQGFSSNDVSENFSVACEGRAGADRDGWTEGGKGAGGKGAGSETAGQEQRQLAAPGSGSLTNRCVQTR